MSLLALVAHPDDASLYCGGTLAKHAARGDEVTVVHMTRGEYGGMDASPGEIAERREREARRAAETLGVEVEFLDGHDGRVVESLETRLSLVDLLRRHAPTLLLTHTPRDLHPDHRATARLVTDAYYMAALPALETDHPPHDPRNVYYVGTTTADYDFEPDVFVRLGEHQSTREAALREHESQLEFLARHGGLDASVQNPVEEIRAEARVLGKRAGCRHAEGFVRLHDRAVEHLG